MRFSHNSVVDNCNEISLQSFDHGGGQYMGKKIKRIFVSICIVTGIALLAVPFYYHFHGQNETDKLIEQFEKTLEQSGDMSR